jgi:signal transduction histidine kinase
MLKGSRELLGQALANLIDNAIKYRDGSDAQRASRVTISTGREGDTLVLRVADNGPGIPAGDRERVLQRFVRLEKSRSQPGSGLGLALAKAIMKFHNGRLDLKPADPGLSVVMDFPERGGD